MMERLQDTGVTHGDEVKQTCKEKADFKKLEGSRDLRKATARHQFTFCWFVG